MADGRRTGGQVTVAVVGAGLRGQGYAQLATAGGRARVVAVAEPDPGRRRALADRYGIPPEATFPGWAELVAAGRLADAAIVATQDNDHVGPAVALAGLGYHLLLEKPMAPTEADAERIATAVTSAGVIAAVCHVLRYTAYTRELVAAVRSGRLGTVVNVQHLEPVGWWHYAHSYVRGNWSNERASGPMLLTKACHDLDWLTYVLDEVPDRVSSFGGLSHFHAANRPEGAGARCVTCAVEPDCPYSATRLYLGCLGDPEREFWPLSAVTPLATRDGVLDALATGRYGRCVYDSDNDVVDHQVVALGYPSGRTATFTMAAFTPMQHRQTRLFGTHGSAEGDGRTLRITDFRTGVTTVIDTDTGVDASAGGAHGGGDGGLITAFLAAVSTGDQSLLSSDVTSSLVSHRLVWAAEHARRTGTVVTPDSGHHGVNQMLTRQ